MKQYIYHLSAVVLLGLIGISYFTSCLTRTFDAQSDVRAAYFHEWGPAISITANEFLFFIPDLAYKITDPTWTAIPLPDKASMNEDLSAYKAKYPMGYEISGITTQISGDYPGTGLSRTEYVFINKDDPTKMLWFSSKKLFMIWDMK
jgi:hypothetical protein